MAKKKPLLKAKPVKIMLPNPIAPPPPPPPPLPCRSQKAKGIQALRLSGGTRFSVTALKEARIFPHEPPLPYPFFGRPCPLRPRHGFVESRLIADDLQWHTLIQEIQATGEPVEVICMPFIEPMFSGVLTPGLIAFGAGHDGATGGKASRAIPTPCEGKAAFLGAFEMYSAAKAAEITEAPYIEFVGEPERIQAVQLRNGPDVNGIEWIPADMTVERVVEVPVDFPLLEWETLIKSLIGKPGVLIWHPGGNMASHYAVQSRCAGVPVTCRAAKPELGALVAKSKDAPEPLTDADYDTLARLIAEAMQKERFGKFQYHEMRLAIAALHAQALWGPERHLLVLRAVAVAAMMRYGAAALLGELRHWTCHGPGKYHPDRKRKTTLKGLAALSCQCTRRLVYEWAFKHSSKDLAERLGTTYEDYMTQPWDGNYGGPNWGNCTQAVAELYRRVGVFCESRSAETWGEVIGGWNLVVNAIHNNGALLTKFIGKKDMDQLAKVPALGFVNHTVARLVLTGDTYKAHALPKWVGRQLKPCMPIRRKKKPGAFALPKTTEARWMIKKGALYVQIKLDIELAKSYGHAAFFTVSPDLLALLSTLPLDGLSFAGTETPYATGILSIVDETLVLTTADGWTQIALDDSAHLVKLIEDRQSTTTEWEFIYPEPVTKGDL